MERVINFRPIFYCLVGFIMGISSFYFLNLEIIFPFLIFILIILVYFIFSYFRKIIFEKSLILLLSFIVGFICCFASFNGFLKQNKGNFQYYGVVDSVEDYNNYSKIILKNVKNYDKDLSIDKNVYLTIYGDKTFTIGDYILFKAELEKVSLFNEDEFNNYYYRNNISYKTSLTFNDITLVKNDLNLFQVLRLKIKSILFNDLSSIYSQIAYSSLIGDKSFISNDYYELFSKTGTAHLLAISGLHISILCICLNYILEKLNIKKIKRFIFIFLFLLFYLTLCGFSVSAIRATIMSLALCLSNTFYYRYDRLSSYCLSLLIILILKPFSLFDPGFQLSALSVFAIIFCYPVINEFLHKILRLENNFLIDSFALSFSTFCFTLPVVINTFNEFSLISIFTNMLVIPLFTLYFLLLLVVLFLCLFFPLTYLFCIPNFVLEIIFNTCNLAFFIPNIKLSYINLVSIIAFILLGFVISKYLMINKKSKIYISSLLIFVMIFSPFIFYFSANKNSDYIYAICNSSNTFLIKDSDTITIVNLGNSGDYVNIINFLKRKNITQIDNVIFSEFKTSIINDLINLNKTIPISKIYFDAYDIENLDYIKANILASSLIFKEINQPYNIKNLLVEKISTQNGTGLNLCFKERRILIINSNLNNALSFQTELKQKLSKIDVISLHTFSTIYKDNILNCLNYFVERNLCEDNTLIKRLGDFTHIKIDVYSKQIFFYS